MSHTPEDKSKELVEKFSKYQQSKFSDEGKLMEQRRTQVLCIDVCKEVIESIDPYSQEADTKIDLWNKVLNHLKTM